MDTLTLSRLVRMAQRAGLDAGRTDNGAAVWVRITRRCVDSREPSAETLLIESAAELAAILNNHAPTLARAA